MEYSTEEIFSLFPYIPLNNWIEAKKQAERSTLRNFRTGAVLYSDKDNQIISKGCSHIAPHNSKGSTHAEEHALQAHYNPGMFYDYTTMVVVTLNKSDNLAYSSRPCLRCTKAMRNNFIFKIAYLERLNNGDWQQNLVSPQTLMNMFEESRIVRETPYAKAMSLDGQGGEI